MLSHPPIRKYIFFFSFLRYYEAIKFGTVWTISKVFLYQPFLEITVGMRYNRNGWEGSVRKNVWLHVRRGISPVTSCCYTLRHISYCLSAAINTFPQVTLVGTHVKVSQLCVVCVTFRIWWFHNYFFFWLLFLPTLCVGPLSSHGFWDFLLCDLSLPLSIPGRNIL